MTAWLPIVERLAEGFGALTLEQRLTRLRGAIDGRIVFTTSLGLEDQAITHAIFSHGLDIEVATLDTGRLFAESHAVWAETEARYGRRIASFHPKAEALEALISAQGPDGFYASIENRKACCHVRKVEPLGRALAGAAAWITGLRADQSGSRAGLGFIERDQARGLVKANPLLDWTRERVAAYVAEHGVPYNRLHDEGFLSIGCQPCTRAVQPGEPERAGRWWWENEDKKECGLHLTEDGRLVRRSA
ncbi:MAG: phosphoadenylyl-sulfate reductase [Alphaproteobacteria bacterium]